jgi:hydroxyethylthiazole kinase-like uncharacterized protein yjeF
MKLLSKKQIYEADRLTVKRQGVSSTDLMERAGTEVFNWMHGRMQGAQVPIHIFCGIGNNGGDGLVLARHLIVHGYEVHTYVVNYSEKRSKDFLINYDRIKEVTKNWPIVLNKGSQLPDILEQDIIVDAIFGIGINRPPDPWVLDLFKHLQSAKAFILSVDIPSGLFMDRALEQPNHALKSNYTLSFQTPKLIFFLKESSQYSTQWEVLDIGLDMQYLSEVQVTDELIGKNEVLVRYKPRDKYAHKGDYGHALMVGGSFGKIGAMILSAKSCLYAGAGLVTAFLPGCGYSIMQSSIPEVMVETDEHETHLTNINTRVKPDVIGVGMGMGTNEQSVKAIGELLKRFQGPYVLDADAINILAAHHELIKHIPKNSILTPHKGELRRLIGDWTDDFEMLKMCSDFSEKHGLIIIVKGAHSITVNGPKRYINTTGNPGMATAGSGDVLSGIVTALIAQKYEPLEAALMGVYLHGKAGDIGVEEQGYQSLVAHHLIDNLGKAYLSLFEQIVEQEADQEPEQP